VVNLFKKITSLLTSSHEVPGGAWIRTDIGVKIWDRKPQLGEIVTWSGAASDSEGYAAGTGILQFMQNGQPVITYEGEMVKGRFHGKGVLRWRDGNSYEGDFMNDQPTGKGIFRWANGDYYEGDFCNGKRTGKGVFLWPNGESYEGDFLDGIHHGKGRFKFINGCCYTGDLVGGNFHGQGVYKFVDGDVYVGKFADDEFSGYGTLYGSDAQILKQGQWVRDEFIGSIAELE